MKFKEEIGKVKSLISECEDLDSKSKKISYLALTAIEFAHKVELDAKDATIAKLREDLEKITDDRLRFTYAPVCTVRDMRDITREALGITSEIQKGGAK